MVWDQKWLATGSLSPLLQPPKGSDSSTSPGIMLLNWIANKLALLIMVSHYQQWLYIYMYNNYPLMVDVLPSEDANDPKKACSESTWPGYGRNTTCWCASSMAMDKQKLLTPQQSRNSSTLSKHFFKCRSTSSRSIPKQSLSVQRTACSMKFKLLRLQNPKSANGNSTF